MDEIIKIVKNLKRIDISKLDGIVEWFDNLLHEYQYLTKMSDKRIERLCILLNRQINKLKDLILITPNKMFVFFIKSVISILKEKSCIIIYII